jgi:hypothetical protein
MIFDGVTATDDFPGEMYMLLDELTNAEKCRLGTVLVQDVEYPWSDGWIGTVVYSDSHRAACRRRIWKSGPVGSQQLASRPQAGGSQHQMVGRNGTQRPWP